MPPKGDAPAPVELLALPAWQAPARTFDDWATALTNAGSAPRVVREAEGDAWLEVGAMRFRGLVLVESGLATAVHFELHDLDPGPATRLIETAATALGWEVHPDEPDDDDDADDDDDEDADPDDSDEA